MKGQAVTFGEVIFGADHQHSRAARECVSCALSSLTLTTISGQALEGNDYDRLRFCLIDYGVLLYYHYIKLKMIYLSA